MCVCVCVCVYTRVDYAFVYWMIVASTRENDTNVISMIDCINFRAFEQLFFMKNRGTIG